jgi:photosystem II stability/assembly factor-like uncharacterized protein
MTATYAHSQAPASSRRGRLTVVVLVALAGVLLILAADAPAAAAADESFVSPFVLAPLIGPWEQYGYAPDYVRYVPTFDSENRAYIRSRTSNAHHTSYVHTLVDGVWTRLDFRAALRAAYPDLTGTVGGGWRGPGVIFDSQDRAYNPLRINLEDGTTRNVLMVSWDRCRTWKVFELPDGLFAVEHWVGHNELDGPPFLAIWEPSGLPPVKGGQRNALWVTKPRLEGEELVVPPLTHVTDECVGLNKDAGGASFAVTHGGTTYFVWGEATPAGSYGVPTYISAYDHATGAVSDKRLLAVTPPANDLHNKPGICSDGEGYLHVVAGTHNAPVLYTRSLQPLSIDAGWSAPQRMPAAEEVAPYAPADEPRQTYNAFVCDSHDTLHLVTRQFREWTGEDGVVRTYGALIHHSLPKGGVWSYPNLILIGADTGYSIYYHKLALDHLDRLYLSLSYAGGQELNLAKSRAAGLKLLGRSELVLGKYRRRLLLVSHDAGLTWRLADDADLAAPGTVLREDSSVARLGDVPPPDDVPPRWSWTSPRPQGNQFTALAVPDGVRGWAVGAYGTIRRTNDGGRTWRRQTSGTQRPLYGLAAADVRSAWAVGEDGLILRTTDSGRTWRRQDSRTDRSFFAATAVSGSTGWAVGARGVVRLTTDGGRTWRTGYSKSAQPFFSVDFVSSLRGWVVGDNGKIMRTTDGGRTWKGQVSPSGNALYGVSFRDRLRGVAVGDGGVILRTLDGGGTWRRMTSSVTTRLSAVELRPTGIGFASGDAGIVLRTADGGRTWRRTQLPTRTTLGALDCYTATRVWTAGAAGVAYRTVDSGRTWKRVTYGLWRSLQDVTQRGTELWTVTDDRLLRSADAGRSWSPAAIVDGATFNALDFSEPDGWAVGDRGLVVHSGDGGATWTALPPQTDERLRAVAAPAPGVAWIAGAEGTLLATSDAGATWRRPLSPADDLYCLEFLDIDRGWVGGGGPYGESAAVVWRTTDGGASWRSASLPVWGRIRALDFVDPDNGWAVAEDWGVDGDYPQGAVLGTRDGGATWELQATTPTVLHAIRMDAAGYGWALGAGGAALQTRDGGLTWLMRDSRTDNTLRGAVLTGPESAVVIGDGGTVLTVSPGTP